MKWIDQLRLLLYFLLFFYGIVNTYSHELQDDSLNYKLFEDAQLLQSRGYGDSAINCYRKIMHNNNDLFISSQVNIASIYCLANNIDSCKFYIDEIRSVNSRDIYECELLVMESNILIRKKCYDEAFSKLKHAEKIAIEKQDSSCLARIFFYYGDCSYYKNNINEAFLNYNEALRIQLKEHILNIETAYYIENIAFIYLLNYNYNKAIEYQNYSYIIKKFVLDTKEDKYTDLFINRVYALRNMSQSNEAINILLLAEKKASKDDSNRKNRYYILSELGNIYSKLDKHELALSYYNKALEIVEQMGEDKFIGELYDKMAYSYLDMKKFNKALDYYHRSIFIKQALGEQDYSGTYRFVAKVYLGLNDSVNAEKLLIMAIENCINNYGKDSKWLVNIYDDYGNFLLSSHHYEDAYKYLTETERIANKYYREHHYYVSRSFLRLGDYYYLNGNVTTALDYYHKSIVSFFYNYEPASYFEVPEEKDLPPYEYAAECLGKKADAMMTIGLLEPQSDSAMIYFKSAMDNYSLALKEIDLLKFEYKDLDFGLLLAEDFKHIFDKAANAAIAAFQYTNDTFFIHKAWMFSEANKSTLIRAMFVENEAREMLHVPPEFEELERQQKNKIVIKRNLIEKEKEKRWPDQEKIHNWNTELINCFATIDSITLLLKEDYPTYFDLKYNTDITEISQVKSKLDDQQLLIEYYLTDTNIIAFAINRDTLGVCTYILDSNFINLVHSYNNYFRSGQPDLTLEGFNDYCDKAYQLYSILLAPFEDLMKEKSLIIIPDDILGLIPFEALITKDVQLNYVDFKNISYLINHSSVLYEYAASFIDNNTIKPHTSPRVIALVPEYQIDIPEKESFINDEYSDLKNLKPLTGAVGEVESISRIYKTMMLMSKDANETNLYDMADEYDILHIAGHTLINDKKPMFSKLVLTMQDDSINDNLLNTYELYNHYLGNKLVVLSGCNTGVGKLRKGEGVISLARGFIYAGCQSIVMTLWSISDNSSAELITGFYENLADGKQKDKALQQAKVSYLRKADPLKAHPYYWAGYICIGNNDTLPKESNISLFIFISLSGVLFLFLYKYLRKCS